jgi:photosystem II stability/assembly factor-like uncharacterized protein
MRESGYYPPGAEFDPRAPWNEVEPEEIECFDCSGSGQDPDEGGICLACQGEGYREQTADEWQEAGENELAAQEEAGERQNEIRLGRD